MKCRRKNHKPSQYAKVCEKHFIDSDFVKSRSFAASMGYTQKLRLQLKSDAVPSVIPKPEVISTPLRKKHKSPKKIKSF